MQVFSHLAKKGRSTEGRSLEPRDPWATYPINFVDSIAKKGELVKTVKTLIFNFGLNCLLFMLICSPVFAAYYKNLILVQAKETEIKTGELLGYERKGICHPTCIYVEGIHLSIKPKIIVLTR